MDSFRTQSGLNVLQMTVLNSVIANFAEVTESEEACRRRCQSNMLSRSRADYPVIFNWLTSPDDAEPANALVGAEKAMVSAQVN